MKKILIIVDVQNGFVRNEAVYEVVQRISALLEKKLFDTIIGTQFLNIPGGRYEKYLGWKRLQNNEDREIRSEIKPFLNHIVPKTTYNCINDSFMNLLFCENDNVSPEYVFVIGLDTDCCVQTIATSLFDHGIRPFVLTHYCFSNAGDDAHHAGISVMQRTIGKGGLIDGEICSEGQLPSTY